MRGRKPTPTVLKIARGNPGKRPINRNEPVPPAAEVKPPRSLVDVEARKEWTRRIAPAITTGHITSADLVLAMAHCDLWSTWRSQLEDAANVPHVVEVGKARIPTASPARLAAHRTLQLLVRVDAELGLTPTSRTRVTVPKIKEATDDDRFFGTG